MAGLLAGFERVFGVECGEPNRHFLRRVEFDDEKIAPVGSLIGTELDGRLYSDLSRISPGRLITPVREFFIRTAASGLLPDERGWIVRVQNGLAQPAEVTIQKLRATARPMGKHLMECAGNVRLTRFGLISVAEWTGTTIAEVLDGANIEGSWIEVSGFDEYSGPSATSIPGASWIFPIDELRAAGAFLATGMNGQTLTRHHGAPVRLVVPGWYGCACIKWVNRIRLVDENVEATSQMREYAVRTLQQGIPKLAKDFDSATVDHAAVPIRVEKWTYSGKVQYRVSGITWGGSEPIRKLQIRFNPDEEFVPVEGFRQTSRDPWTLWTQAWRPREPGQYTIRLAITDPPVRARKLELGLYDRSINIDEV